MMITVVSSFVHFTAHLIVLRYRVKFWFRKSYKASEKRITRVLSRRRVTLVGRIRRRLP
jgi:hypothetical protein